MVSATYRNLDVTSHELQDAEGPWLDADFLWNGFQNIHSKGHKCQCLNLSLFSVLRFEVQGVLDDVLRYVHVSLHAQF